MVAAAAAPPCRIHAVSVLALSSRFDGLITGSGSPALSALFQYSLCRVVLMVYCLTSYSKYLASVSVLALSSRFDGQSAFSDSTAG